MGVGLTPIAPVFTIMGWPLGPITIIIVGCIMGWPLGPIIIGCPLGPITIRPPIGWLYIIGVGVMAAGVGVRVVGVRVAVPRALDDITGPVDGFIAFMGVFTGLVAGAVLAGEAPRLDKSTKSDFQRLAGPCAVGASIKSVDWESGNAVVNVEEGMLILLIG